MPEERIDIRTRLIGARQFIRDSYAAAASMAAMGTAAETAGRGMQRATHRSFLMNQAFFTMRRYLYNATLAMSALGAAALYTGYTFDASVQRTTIALEFLSKGQFDANTQMREFLQIARDTAFVPKEVIAAGQQLIAFGFTAEETNRTLRAMGDAIGALNLPQDTVARITLALGQIRSKGKLMGEELRQLANANVLSFDALSQALGRNVFQLGNIADANIPASVAIDAILTSMEARFRGASARIRETTSGQMEVLKGDLQAILGGAIGNLFDQLGGRLERVTNTTGKMFDAVVYANAGFYDLVYILDQSTGGSYHLVYAIETLHGALRAAWNSSKLIIDVLTPFAKIVLLLTFLLLELTTSVLNFVNLGGEPLVWVLRLIVLWMITERIALKLIWIWTNRATAAKIVHAFFTRRLAAVIRILTFWKTAEAVATKRQTAWEARRISTTSAAIPLARKQNTLIKATTALTWRQVAAQIAALVTNPYVLLALAALALGAALVILWQKFEDLRPIIGIIMFQLSPLLLLIMLLVDHIERLSGALDSLKGKFDFFENLLPGGIGQASLLDIGKSVFGGGGAEAAATGGGVAPQQANWQTILAGGGMGTIEPAPVIIDGRQLAEVVFKHRGDRMARR